MSQYCVLVASSDSRKDIFDICFANSDHIWADCDWPKYVGLNSLPGPPQVHFGMVVAPATDDWCEQVKRYVDLLPPDIRYILLMVEDVLFMQPINAMLLDDIAKKMQASALNYLRLVPLRRNWLAKIVHWIEDSHREFPFREIEPNEPYYSSTEMAIWRRDHLLNQLGRANDAWDFEHLTGTGGHWAVLAPVFDQHQIVQKGHWNWDAPKLVRQAGLIWHHSNRPFQTVRSRLRGHLANLSFALFGYTSFRLKRWMGVKT